jgi:hypothetical protein
MQPNRDAAVGVFEDPEQARDALDALRIAGFDSGDIGLLMPHGRESVLGDLGEWLIGMGALSIPGVGPVLAAGALGATLSGALLGAGLGAVAGALSRLGIPEREAQYYDDEVRAGRTLILVHAGARVDEARRILHEYGARDAHDRAAAVSK